MNRIIVSNKENLVMKSSVLKSLLLTIAVVIMLQIVLVNQVKALLITQTLPEYSSPSGVGSSGQYLVGTFNYAIPSGEEIIAANISGVWGNSLSETTSTNQVFVDNILVADTALATPLPNSNPFVEWSFSFTDFSVLEDGSADFIVDKISDGGTVRLGETTLQIETAHVTPIPEPSTILFIGTGLVGLAGLRRKLKK